MKNLTKNKNTIKTQNRQKQPDKIHRKKQQKQKNKNHKKNNQNLESDKFWFSCVFLVFFSVCSGIVFLKPYILYAVGLKSLVYKKVQNKLLTVIFGSREKEEWKNVWKEGGTGPPLLRIHFLNFWVRYD